jgi:hypothetical protein
LTCVFDFAKFFIAIFWPWLFAVAGGQKSLQVPKKEAKHDTQRLGVDEERLPSS